MRAITILKRALALMDAGRWVQSDWNKPERRINVRTGRRMARGRAVTCYCAAGAIRHAGKGLSRNFEGAEALFLEAIGRKDQRCDQIWDWNDHVGRTVGDVRRAFRKAIKLAA